VDGHLRAALACIAAVIAALASAPATAAPVAATPPMGWNSWDSFGCAVNERDVRQAADELVASGMRATGYRYVVVDDCWYDPNRDAHGNLRADPQRFPSGIAALAEYVHSRGLKLGIYESPLDKTCAERGWPEFPGASRPGTTGSLGHERQDAETFAAWGVDYLKYDYCSSEGSVEQQAATFTKMRDALRATGRQIVYSINPNSDHATTGASYDWSRIANLWRVTQDVVPAWDSYAFQSEGFMGIVNAIDADAPLTVRAGPGHWNDPDMLVVGDQLASFVLHDGAGAPESLTGALAREPASPTLEEMRTQFSMWSMMAAPLMAGNDLRAMPAAIRAILTNRDVIALDQDPLGAQAAPTRRDSRVWAKPLAGGAVAVALLNRTELATTIATTARDCGLPPAARYRVRDLWTGAESSSAGPISAQVAAHATAVLRIEAVGPKS
jgi:alpha-galactosidase